jgi:hypothetical protein
MLQQHDLGYTKRLETILELVLRHNVHLEFEITKNHSDRLKNEHHLPPEQREFEIRSSLSAPKSRQAEAVFTGAVGL